MGRAHCSRARLSGSYEPEPCQVLVRVPARRCEALPVCAFALFSADVKFYCKRPA